MKKIHPVLMQVVGIVLFSYLLGEFGFIGFVGIQLARYNLQRWWAGWKYGHPDTIMPIWLSKKHPHIRKFYMGGAAVGLIVANVLIVLGWQTALYTYLAFWWTIFITDQVIAFLYMRRHARRVRRGPSFLA